MSKRQARRMFRRWKSGDYFARETWWEFITTIRGEHYHVVMNVRRHFDTKDLPF